MRKKSIIIPLFFFCSVMFLAGCETMKGVGYVAEGLKKDAQSFWRVSSQAVLKTDDWIKENLW